MPAPESVIFVPATNVYLRGDVLTLAQTAGLVEVALVCFVLGVLLVQGHAQKLVARSLARLRQQVRTRGVATSWGIPRMP